jgi:predicted lipid-binding transport protein (Tim44 family)
MKTILRVSVIAISLVFMLLADVSILPIQLVPEAQAVLGVRRRTAVVASSAAHAEDAAAMSQSQQQAAAAQQQAAASQQQAAAATKEAEAAKKEAEAAKQQAAAAAPPAPAPAAAGKPLPLGTVVSALPQGCVATPVGGVEYYYCGGNFYRAVFQGNQLVYVTAQPK